MNILNVIGAMEVYRMGRRVDPYGIIKQQKLSYDYYLVIEAKS